MKFSQEISIFKPHAIEYEVVSLGSRITQTASEIRLETEQKLTNYSTTIEMDAAISVLPHTVTLGVNGKVGKEGNTGASISVSLYDADGNLINADSSNIYIDGEVIFSSQLTDGTTLISGSNIKTGTINASLVNVTNINASNITTGTLTGRDISGGRILQVVSGAQHGDIWGSGTSFITQASIQDGIVQAGQYVLNGVNILAEGVDWDGEGSPGVQVCGHLSTVGTIWAGDEYTDRFRVNCRGNIWTNNIWVNNLGGWITDYVWSDRRYKDKIKALDYGKAVNFINSLKPVSFVYTNRAADKGIHHGFIAQDIQKIAYDDWGLVKESENPDTGQDYLTLSYDDIIADLVATVQSQNERITDLERRNNG